MARRWNYYDGLYELGKIPDYCSRLTYNKGTRQILFDGEVANINTLRANFCLANRVSITSGDFYSVLLFYAQEQTLADPVDILRMRIIGLASKSNRILTREIVSCLMVEMPELTMTKKELEMRITSVLKEEGYTKKRSNTTTCWIKENKKEKTDNA